ncbi:MAG: signal peptidase I [Bacteroidales bacterium]|jgi:signal peptidase I|nr:signal peptidase I [Bacteroidales bacterium]
MNISIPVLAVYTVLCFVGNFVGLAGVFKKAGVPAWKALVPVYQLFVWIKVLQKPKWWLIFAFIPYFGIFVLMLMTWRTIRMFDKTRYITLIPATFFPFISMPYYGFSKKEIFYKLEDLPAKHLGFWHSTPIKNGNKKEPLKGKITKTKVRDWSDNLIYAGLAAYLLRTFLFELYTIPTSSEEGTLMVGDYLVVSKVAYGPKIPQTAIAIPFIHNVIPKTQTRSYTEWIELPYLRFWGFGDVQRNNAVVFNCPDGDTVALERSAESYYAILRQIKRAYQNPQQFATQCYMGGDTPHQYGELFNKYGANYYPGKEYDVVKNEYHVISRPEDKRENYIKRCVAVAGDKLEIKNAVLYINDKPAYEPPKMQMRYIVTFNGYDLNEENRQRLDVNEEDHFQIAANMAIYHLNKEQAKQLATYPNIVSVVPDIEADTIFDPDIFPFDERYKWNKDFYGPIIIPKKGMTVEINDSTIVLYSRIIKNYEYNDLEIKSDGIYINGQKSDSYTFKMDYFWMMGDNRHNSADSRFWGFVPENHVVGKASFVWLSLDKYKKMGKHKIRWNRMFRAIK